jgi:protoporphyrinogen oxidase
LKIGIVGAGITGLSAAHDLLGSGHQVVLYEASPFAGGLASGFRDEEWDWPLERFYHHLFTSDKDIIALVGELGMRDDLFFPRPITSVIHDGQIVPFDSPKAWITFPGFNYLDVVRFGLVSAYLRFTNPWRRLEKVSADSWLRRWYGNKIYETVWRPLLIGKFGPYYGKANMAWMWARLKVRSPRLGYFRGGFQAFVDRLVEAVKERGGEIHLAQPVEKIEPLVDGRLVFRVKEGGAENDAKYNAGLVTTSPGAMGRMVPALPENYRKQLASLKSMGAVVLVLALRNRLMNETYWLNLPADSPDKIAGNYPFLALVEHTNYIDRRHYAGDHILYCGDYVTPDHPYLDMEEEELVSTFLAALPQFNGEFRPEWVRKRWLFRTRYAQPVPVVNHSKRLPPLETPLTNLFLASMSQVYPWDRGTNFAVEMGRRVAATIMEQFV